MSAIQLGSALLQGKSMLPGQAELVSNEFEDRDRSAGQRDVPAHGSGR